MKAVAPAPKATKKHNGRAVARKERDAEKVALLADEAGDKKHVVQPKPDSDADLAAGTEFGKYLKEVADEDKDDSAGVPTALWIAGGVGLVGGAVALASGGEGNKPPTVTSPVAVTVAEDGSAPVTITASDPNNDSLNYSASTPTNGTVSQGTGGSFTYMPRANFNGTDTFTVTVSDGKEQVTATVNVTVTAVNDAPTVANAIPDQSVAEDSPLSYQVASNAFADIDNATLTYSATLDGGAALPTWLAFDAATRTFSGTPPLNFNGSLDVRVTASDGALSASDVFRITVTPVNDAPTVANALQDLSSAEDTALSYQVPANAFADVDNATLTYSATLDGGAALPAWLSFNAATRTFSGTPPLNFNGSLDVRVTASDGALSASDVFRINITPVNDAPVVAATQSVAGNEDVAVNVTVSATDVDNTSLTYTAGAATNGTVSGGGANGAFVYTPNPDFRGTDSFTVAVSDGLLTTNQVVTVNVASNVNEVRSIDLAGSAAVQEFDAAGSGFTAGDNFKFTDDSSKATNAIITNFAAGDTIEVTGASTDYNFTAEGNDLVITYNNTQAGIENVIVLKDVGASAGFIEDEVTAELVLGRNFFTALTGTGAGGDGVRVNENLDDDTDANLQTYAVANAAGGDVAFTEDASIANAVVITGFGAGDTISVSNAATSAYSFTASGNDVVISFLNGALSNEIVLQGVATGVTTLIDSIDDVEKLVGVGFFKAAATGGGPITDPTGSTDSIDVGTTGSTVTKNAAAGAIKFTDTVNQSTDVLIQGFGSDDRIQTNGTAGDYNFGIIDDGKDLEIVFNNTAAGVLNSIVLDNVFVDQNGQVRDVFVADYATAQAAVGFNFMIFG